MRIVLSGRTSGESQASQATIKTQVDVMRAKAQAMGWAIVDEFLDEDCFNWIPIDQRPEGGRLLRMLPELKIEAVLVYDLGRWSRTPHIYWTGWHELNKLGIRLISATQDVDDRTHEGRLWMNVLLGFAQYDGSKIVQKLGDGRNRVVKETWVDEDGREYGYWMGGTMPYGYVGVTRNKRLAAIPDRALLPGLTLSPADVIVLIFRWCVEDHLTCQAIADRLNALGVPRHGYLPSGSGRPDGGKHGFLAIWVPVGVRQILTRAIYRGEHRFRDVVRPMPALVSTAMWYRAQEILKENRAYADRNSDGRYLLRGKIRCGHPGCNCGWYGARPGTYAGWRWRRTERVVYRCQGANVRKKVLAARGVICPAPQIDGSRLEMLVMQKIRHFVDHPSESLERLRRDLQTGGVDHERLQAEIDDRQQRLRQIDRRKARVLELYENDRIDMVAYDRRIAEIDHESDTLRDELTQREHILRETANLQHHLSAIEEFLLETRERVADHWDEFETQRRLVEQLVQEIVVTPDPERKLPPHVTIRLWGPQPINATDNSTRPSRIICCIVWEGYHLNVVSAD